MARKAEFIVAAKDEAAATLRRVQGQISGLSGALARLPVPAAFGQLNAQINTLSSGLGSLSGMAGPVGLAVGAVVALGGAVVGLAAKTAGQVEQFDLLAGSTGASIQQLQVLRKVFEDAGASGADVPAILQKLSKSIGENDPLLKRLNITGRDSIEVLLQLADRFENSSDTAAKQVIAQQLLGLSSADLIGIVSGLRGAYDETSTSMRAAGALMSDDMVKSARELDRQMDQLKTTWEGALNRISSVTVPWALQMVESFNEVWDRIGGKDDTVADVEAKIRRTQDALKAMTGGAEEIKRLQQRIRELVEELDRLGASSDRARLAAIHGDDPAFRKVARAKDPLAGAAAPPTESPREKQLKEIQRLLGVGRAEADRYADALKRVSDAAAAAKAARDVLQSGVALEAGERARLQATALGPDPSIAAYTRLIDNLEARLNAARVVREKVAGEIEATTARIRQAMQDLPGAEGQALRPGLLAALAAAAAQGTTAGPVERRRPKPPMSEPIAVDAEKDKQLKEELLATVRLLPEAYRAASAAWTEFLDQQLSGTQILKDTFGALYDGLNAGIGRALDGILHKTMTVTQGLRAMFKAIAEELERLAAKLLASKIMQLLLKLLEYILGSGGAGGKINVGNSLTPVGPGGRGSGSAGPRRSPDQGLVARFLEENAATLAIGERALQRRSTAPAFSGPRVSFRGPDLQALRVALGVPAPRNREELDRGPRVQMTIHYSSLDSRSLYDQFVSPFGTFRNVERDRMRLRLVHG